MEKLLEAQNTWLIKRYHTLCGKLGLSAEEREALLVSNYGVHSSKDLSLQDLSELCNRLAISADDRLKQMDVWRKRLIAAIGGWLRAMGKDGRDIAKIKAIACRAAEAKAFNAITLERLRSLYYAFSKRRKDLAKVTEMTAEELDILSIMN